MYLCTIESDKENYIFFLLPKTNAPNKIRQTPSVSLLHFLLQIKLTESFHLRAWHDTEQKYAFVDFALLVKIKPNTWISPAAMGGSSQSQGHNPPLLQSVN